jgi:hypothetical protein
MATPIIPNILGTDPNTGTPHHEKSSRLMKAEQDKLHYTTILNRANEQLALEKNLQFAAQDQASDAQYDLKILRAENPVTILNNQKKSLELATNALTETQNKTVLGTIEMIAMNVSVCAAAMIALRFLATDLFSTLISFKFYAMSLLSGTTGASGLLGWSADRKAALNIRMAQDNVNASQKAVSECKISCKDYDKKLKEKIAAAVAAQQELKKITERVRAATEVVQQAEHDLSRANKQVTIHTNRRVSANTNSTFAQMPPAKDALASHDLAPELTTSDAASTFKL